MHICQRCEGAVNNWNSMPCNLLGGVVADLCTTCQTAWQERAYSDARYPDLLAWDAQEQFLRGRAIAQDAPTEEEWLAFEQKKDEVKRYFFEVGKAWLAEEPTPVEQEGR